MAHPRHHFVLIHQPVGNGHRLLGFAGVIALHQHNFFTVYAARRVNVRRGLAGTLPVLRTVGGIRSGKRPGPANLYVSQRLERHA